MKATDRDRQVLCKLYRDYPEFEDTMTELITAIEAGMSPEQRAQLRAVEPASPFTGLHAKRLENQTVDTLILFFTSADMLSLLSIDDRSRIVLGEDPMRVLYPKLKHSLSPAERLEGLSPEEIVAVLPAEQLEQIRALLNQVP